MLDNIESCFRDLLSALQTARLYSDWHPQFKKSLAKAYESLQEVLAQKDELVIGIIGDELAFEKEIFFELSKTVKPMILYLKERGIERFAFHRGVEEEELSKFITFLIVPKEELKHEAEEELSLRGVKNIVVGKIKAAGVAAPAAQKLAKSVSYFSVFEDSLDNVTNSLEAIMNEEKVDHLALRMTVSNVMDSLLGRYQEFLTFATMKRYDLASFFHILNVSMLSMYFASKMGFAKDEILDIGTAALFHDIGKIYISRKIIKKPDKLTTDEFESIRNHVIKGTEILLKYVDTLGVLPVVVCFEHHLKYDLSGYPKVSGYPKLHIASLIVSICDVYDALSQRRVYKGDYPPEIIYDLMMREKGKGFEPVLLDKFFKVIGVWPLDTIVELSDKKIGVVREENEDDIFSPKVEIISSQDKKEVVDLRTLKGQVKIERTLNPLTEGKDYLPLIKPA